MTNRYLPAIRKTMLIAWAALIVFCAVYYATHLEAFTSQAIADFLLKHKERLILLYSLLSLMRGLTLLPSTPLVIAGALAFPTQPFLVLTISIIGVLFSSVMIYFFSDYLGLSDYFNKKYPKQLAQTRERLERPSGLLFLLLWSFFPLVPTDLACYVAGTARMAFAKFILVVFIGEMILCSACIYTVSAFFV